MAKTRIMVPGWPYSIGVALETGRSSWTAPLDAVRLAPGDDAATVTVSVTTAAISVCRGAGRTVWRSAARTGDRFRMPPGQLLLVIGTPPDRGFTHV